MLLLLLTRLLLRLATLPFEESFPSAARATRAILRVKLDSDASSDTPEAIDDDDDGGGADGELLLLFKPLAADFASLTRLFKSDIIPDRDIVFVLLLICCYYYCFKGFQYEY